MAGGNGLARRAQTPLSPAKAQAQIQPERPGMTRLLAEPQTASALGSSRIPAFAGKSGLERLYFAAALSAAKPALAATVVRNVPQAMSARVMVVDHVFNVA